MEKRKWFDQTQPQTLQGAVLLSYISAVFGLLSILFGSFYVGVILLAEGVAANGMANEARWGYILGIVAASLYVVVDVVTLPLVGLGSGVFFVLLNLAFAILLVVLLLHPQSREYQRVWFH